MNSSLLNLFSLQSQTPTSSVGSSSFGSSLGASKSNGANLGDVMFGQLLSAQLQNSKTAQAGSNASSGQSALLAQFQTTITQLLQKGYSLEQIANQLSTSLGSNVLAQLQLQFGLSPNSNVRSALTQMIAQALGPPGNGPPQTAAQM